MPGFSYDNILPLPTLDQADAAMASLATTNWTPDQPLPTTLTSFRASSHWHLRSRWLCRKPRWRSVAEIWQNPPPPLRAALDDPNTTKQDLLRKLRSYSYVASQFNPYAAAAIYNFFCPPGGTVLDPCAGWGDRLAAALGSTMVGRYVGFDANAALQPGYQAQIDRYGSDGVPHSVTHAAFEDVTVPEEAFDLVFTSPPYVRAEIYSADPEQSSYRYPNYQAWKDGFLTPLINAAWKALKPGRCLVLNVAPGHHDLGKIYCDLPADCLSIAAKTGFTLCGSTVLPLAHRKQEPVLIWRK